MRMTSAYPVGKTAHPAGKIAHPTTMAEVPPGPSGPGEVVIDIGGRTGALVVYAPAELDGEEVEVRPAGAAWDGTHVAVRERRLPGGSRWAALFGALPEGRYEVRLKGQEACPVISADVPGGRVASAEWPPV